MKKSMTFIHLLYQTLLPTENFAYFRDVVIVEEVDGVTPIGCLFPKGKYIKAISATQPDDAGNGTRRHT